MNKKSYIAVVAARSGGHIIPGLTLAQNYVCENPVTKIIIFSTHDQFDQQILSNYSGDITHIKIPLDNVPRKLLKYPFFILQFIWSLLVSSYYLAKYKPCSLIVMGGYVSIPVSIAAKILCIPRRLYELNAVPGKATAFLTRHVCPHVSICFAQAVQYPCLAKAELVQYPVRFASVALTRQDACAALDLDPQSKIIFVLGGSQGSVFLNNALLECLRNNMQLCSKIAIVNQTGSRDKNNLSGAYSQLNLPAVVFDYHHDLSVHYMAADIVIARAGAGTIFEVLFFKKKCILVPLELSGNDHQLSNARAIVQDYPGLFTLIEQKNLVNQLPHALHLI